MKKLFFLSFILFTIHFVTAQEIQWQKTIGGNDYDILKVVHQTADLGYILGGYSRSVLSGNKTEGTIGNTGKYDIWIVKTDSVGTIQWENTIGGNEYDRLFAIQQTTDGGYILGTRRQIHK